MNFIAAILMLCRAEQAGLHGHEAKAKAEACIVEVKQCVKDGGGDEPAFDKCRAAHKK